MKDTLNNLDTPYYKYDMALLEQTLNIIRDEALQKNFEVHYAIKANSNEPILKMIKKKGFGADCVSGNEVQHALNIGFDAGQIAFAGVGKSDKEIELGIKNDIFSFNVESFPELELINEIAVSIGKVANVALRINPNVEANTHKYISTGTSENKFGIDEWELENIISNLKNMPAVNLKGLHFHIGSQITEMSNFKNLCIRVNYFNDLLSNKNINIQHINVGGGLGVNYYNPDSEPIADFASYFAVFNDYLILKPHQKLHFELGRSIVAQCGSLISRVLYIKKGLTKKFAIIDASMTNLLRPALYHSFHFIESLQNFSAIKEVYDIVGPVCESSDVFRKEVELPSIKRGDLISIRSVGAYGEVMSSSYNMRDMAKAVYVF